MSSQVIHLSLLATAVFVASLLGTGLVRWLAGRFGWVAQPREDRWHQKPTALHGGMGFFPAFALGAAWVLIARYGSATAVEHLAPKELSLAAALLIGSMLMCLFGLWDDLQRFKPATKLLVEVSASSLFVFAGGIFPLTGAALFDTLVTYLWFIGITNAVNMLDNMDGLSSGVVLLAGATLVVLSVQGQSESTAMPLATWLGTVLVATLAGFLVYNYPPASIFMGDSGSLFIGYVLAALAVPSDLNAFMGFHQGDGHVLGSLLVLLIPMAVLAVPIFDTTLVTITRKWRSQKASEGGRDHSSHRLVGLGLSERTAVWTLYTFAAFGGGVAILLQKFPNQSCLLLGLYILILILSGVYIGHVKVQVAQSAQPPPKWTPLVSRLMHKRRAAEVLLDTAVVMLCFYGAYLLRFEGELSEPAMRAIAETLPIVLLSCLTAFFFSGIYRGQWRLISVADIPTYTTGVLAGTVVSLGSVTLLTRFEGGHSRSAYLIFSVLLFVALLGSRLSFRLFDMLLARNGNETKDRNRPVILIYGAGKAGKLVHDEAIGNTQMREYQIIGFVDDDPTRVGRTLCGVPIRTAAEWLTRLKQCPSEIWVSSRFIAHERVMGFASGWNGRPTVRRFKLELEPLGDGWPAEAGGLTGAPFGSTHGAATWQQQMQEGSQHRGARSPSVLGGNVTGSSVRLEAERPRGG